MGEPGLQRLDTAAQREVDEAVIRGFVVREKRERYLTFVRSAKHRRKFLQQLYHPTIFDERCVRAIPDPQTAPQIEKLLRDLGAGPTCETISANRDLDGLRGPLSEIVRSVVGMDGVIVSCVPGRLAYMEPEYRDCGRHVLFRPAAR